MHKNTDEKGVNLGIIITPMLDMSFQILAFFIMTYHPSALEGHFDIKLLPPRATTMGPTKINVALPPSGIEPEFTDVLTVQIKAVANGQPENGRVDGDPSRILLIRPEDAGTAVAIADTDMPFEDGLKKLGVELKKFLEDHGKANIKIEPDAGLKHRYTMEAYDACKRSGFQNIQFVGPAFEVRK